MAGNPGRIFRLQSHDHGKHPGLFRTASGRRDAGHLRRALGASRPARPAHGAQHPALDRRRDPAHSVPGDRRAAARARPALGPHHPAGRARAPRDHLALSAAVDDSTPQKARETVEG